MDLLSRRSRRGWRGLYTAWSLRRDEARLLHRIAIEQVQVSDWDQRACTKDLVSMGTLRNRALVTMPGDHYVLTPPVAHSLGLASPTVGGARPARQG